MGPGIAQVFATGGYMTILTDIKKEALEMAKQKIQSNLETLIAAGEISKEDADVCWNNIAFTLWPLQKNPDADFVLEAVPEIPDLKAQVFKELDDLCRDETILSSTTSALIYSNLSKFQIRRG